MSVNPVILGTGAVGGGALGYLFGKYILNLKSTPSLIATTGAGAALGAGAGGVLSAHQSELQKKHEKNLEALRNKQTILQNVTGAPALAAGGLVGVGVAGIGGGATDALNTAKSIRRAKDAIIDEKMKVAKADLEAATKFGNTAAVKAASDKITDLELLRKKSVVSEAIGNVFKAGAKQPWTTAVDTTKKARWPAAKFGIRSLVAGVPANALTAYVLSRSNQKSLEMLESEDK